MIFDNIDRICTVLSIAGATAFYVANTYLKEEPEGPPDDIYTVA